MKACESVLSSEALGDIREISPIVQPDMSDSASLDNVFEFFVMSGLSLPHAMAVMVPESSTKRNPISEDLKAFYEYHSILMEPMGWPAALLFSVRPATPVVCSIETVCAQPATLIPRTI